MTGIPDFPASSASPVPPVVSAEETFLREEAAELPPAGTGYIRFLRGPQARTGRGAFAIALALADYFVVGSIVLVPLFLLPGILPPRVWEQWGTPLSTIVLLLSVALILPLLFPIQRAVFRIDGRWLHSVAGRFRWSLALRAALISTVVLALTAFVQALVSRTPIAPDLSVPAIVGAVGAVVLVPFQAAAEEYFTRGIIARSVASWFRSPFAGLLVSALSSSLVFALLHGNLLPGLMLYYLVLGVLLWVVAWFTGGLEAAIAVHAVFNISAFVQSFLFAEPAAFSTTITAESQFSGMRMLAVMALLVAVLIWRFRRSGVQRIYRPSDYTTTTTTTTTEKGDS